MGAELQMPVIRNDIVNAIVGRDVDTCCYDRNEIELQFKPGG